MVAMLSVASAVIAQKSEKIKPPPETSPVAETQQWLIAALGKYGTYKTRVESITLSNLKFDGCAFTFTRTRKSGSTSTATMGPTRTTYAAKDDIKIQIQDVRAEGIALEDHIYPEIQTIKIWMTGFDLTEGSSAGRIYDIVVKREAGDALKTALMQIQRSCVAKN